MEEAYRVGVSILLNESQLFSALDKAMAVFDKINKSVKDTNEALGRTARTIQDAAQDAARLVDNMERVARAARSGGGSGGGSSFHPLALTGTRTSNLPALLSGGGGGMPPFIFPGGSAGGGGGGILGLVSSAGRAAMELEMVAQAARAAAEKMAPMTDATARARGLGIDYDTVMGARAQSYQIATQIPGVTGDQAMNDWLALRATLGNDDEASAALKGYEKIRSASGLGDTGLHQLLKAAELRGDAIDPVTGAFSIARLMAGLDAERRAVALSNGLLSPADILNNVKQAGPAARTERDAMQYWAQQVSAVLDMGGSRAGTAQTALARQLFGGRMTQPTALEMSRIGLLPSGSWHTLRGGGVQVDDKELADVVQQIGKQGWNNYFQTVVLPKLKQAGYNSPEQISAELYKLFGTETARRMAALQLLNDPQIKRDANLMAGMPGVDAVIGTQMGGLLTDGSISKNLQAFDAAFQNLSDALGEVVAPAIIIGLQSFAGAMNDTARVIETVAGIASNARHDLGSFLGWFSHTPLAPSYWDPRAKIPGVQDQAYHPGRDYVPPPMHISIMPGVTNINVDGRTLARTVSEYQSAHMGLPPRGMSGYDMSMSPHYPGQQADV